MPALLNQEPTIDQFSDKLANQWPRSSDHFGEFRVAEFRSQQGAARFDNAEALSQLFDYQFKAPSIIKADGPDPSVYLEGLPGVDSVEKLNQDIAPHGL
jgi:hypothetical protein